MSIFRLYKKQNISFAIFLATGLVSLINIADASVVTGAGYTLHSTVSTNGLNGSIHSGGGYTLNSRINNGGTMNGGVYIVSKNSVQSLLTNTSGDTSSGGGSSSGGSGVVGLVDLSKIQRFTDSGFVREEKNLKKKTTVTQQNLGRVHIVSSPPKDSPNTSFLAFLDAKRGGYSTKNTDTSQTFSQFLSSTSYQASSFFAFTASHTEAPSKVQYKETGKVQEPYVQQTDLTLRQEAAKTKFNVPIVLDDGQMNQIIRHEVTPLIIGEGHYPPRYQETSKHTIEKRGNVSFKKSLTDTPRQSKTFFWLLTGVAMLLSLIYSIMKFMQYFSHTQKSLTSSTLNALTLVFLPIGLLLMLSATPAEAFSNTIGYQGYVSNQNGIITNSTIAIRFRLYSSITNGVPVWDSGEQNILINNGSFNIELGSAVPFNNAIDFNSNQYYLEIIIEGNPLSPRESLGTASYSRSTAGVQSSPSTLSVPNAGGLYYNTINKTLSTSNGTTWDDVLTTSVNATTTIKGSSRINGNAKVDGYQVVTGDFTANGVTNLATTTIGGALTVQAGALINGNVDILNGGHLKVAELANYTTIGANGEGVLVDGASDENLKNIQGSFNRGVDDLLNIDPITYTWRSGLYYRDGEESGFSAQNIQNTIPEAVKRNNKGFLTLSDRPIIATIVNAVKEIWAKITSFGHRIDAVEQELEDLRESLDLEEDIVDEESEEEDLIEEEGGVISTPEAPAREQESQEDTETDESTEIVDEQDVVEDNSEIIEEVETPEQGESQEDNTVETVSEPIDTQGQEQNPNHVDWPTEEQLATTTESE